MPVRKRGAKSSRRNLRGITGSPPRSLIHSFRKEKAKLSMKKQRKVSRHMRAVGAHNHREYLKAGASNRRAIVSRGKGPFKRTRR